MRALAVAATAWLALTPVSSYADAADELAGCMFDNTGPEAEEVMKGFIVAVLEEAPQPELQERLGSFGVMMMNLAVQSCKYPFAELGAPVFQQATEQYGQRIMARIMERAFAGAGLK